MKKCIICNEVKELKEFPKRNGSKDGYRNNCKLCKNIVNKKYRDNNKEKINEYTKKYKEENKEKLKIQGKNYYINNIDIIKERGKIYRQKNKGKRNGYMRDRKMNPLYKLSSNIRWLIYYGFNTIGIKKNKKTESILGCSFEEFKIYIERQFEVWMNWDNNGKYTGNYNETWQIDHIIPVSKATTQEEIIKLNHFTNLRPFCSRKNLEKGNKF